MPPPLPTPDLLNVPSTNLPEAEEVFSTPPVSPYPDSEPHESNPLTSGISVEFHHFCAHIADFRAQGRRPEQQDETLVLAPMDLSLLLSHHPRVLAHVPQPLALLAVMDGHGFDGGKISRSVRTQFLNDAQGHIVTAFCHEFAQPNSDHLEHSINNAIHAFLDLCFKSLHSHLTTDSNLDAYNSGTTLVTAVITSTHIHVASVGDSRAVLGIVHDDGTMESRALTLDHTCANKDELDRVLQHGARVDYSPYTHDSNSKEKGPLRIYKGDKPYPGLVVTRALGDSAATALGVLSTPEITHVPLTPYLALLPHPLVLILVLASDGVWDAHPDEDKTGHEVIEVIHSVLSRANSQGIRIGPRVASVAAKKVIKTALQGLDKLQLDDNVSTACAILTINP